ncbi:MAG: hypothetical protein EOM74_01925, partial [Methanomicrobia archaeon]|nr:hypothetical protein [Methanomicrobia archaeon]
MSDNNYKNDDIEKDCRNMTKEEAKKEYDRLMAEFAKYDTFQLAVKLQINAIYGAFGAPFFYFYNPNIAHAITGQGKDLILYTETAINDYFHTEWMNDSECHKRLGITVKTPVTDTVSVYIDTDSCAKGSIVEIDEDIINVTVENGMHKCFNKNDT